MNPSRLAMLRLRAELYALVRRFFADRNVLEVETPILSAAGNTEPNIEGFATRFTGHVDAGPRERYLRTSPEYPLKRLLAEGLGDCYEMGRVFRNGEVGKRHNPEFTMLEWYRVGFDHRRLAEETVELVQAAQRLAAAKFTQQPLDSSFQRRLESSEDGAPSAQDPGDECFAHHASLDSSLRWNDGSGSGSGVVPGQGGNVRIITYRELFRQALDIDPFDVDLASLRAPLADFGIDPEGLVRDDWLDLLLTHRIQPAFRTGDITVIHDWPASQCALARIRQDDPPVAERFELYLGRYELANGYHELDDAAEQRARFVQENRRREQRGQAALPLDENLLASLDALPGCSGVALGIERLLMCILETDAITDVMSFTFAEA